MECEKEKFCVFNIYGRFVNEQQLYKLKKSKIMKKFFAFAAIATFVSILVASCGSSRGHCDAYGSTSTIENADLASK